MHRIRARTAVVLVLLAAAIAVWAHVKLYTAEPEGRPSHGIPDAEGASVELRPAEWRLTSGIDSSLVSLAATGERAFVGGNVGGSRDSWVVYATGTRQGWEEVRSGRGRLLGLVCSTDGEQLLVGVEHHGMEVEWLDVSGVRPKLIEQVEDEDIGGASRTDSGTAWVGLYTKASGRKTSRLVLHRGPGDAETLSWPGPNGTGQVSQLADYWPDGRSRAAYLLLHDGRLYRFGDGGDALVLRLPLEARPALEWRRYSHVSSFLFALSGTTLIRAEIRSGRIETRDLRHLLRGLGVPSGYSPRLQAVSKSAVLLITEPLGEGSEKGACIYLVRYPELRARKLLALPPHSLLARSTTGHGVAVAGGVIWVAWYDFSRKELVLNRLSVDE